MVPIGEQSLDQKQCEALVLSTMTDEQRREFYLNKELNFAVISEESGRFRASAFSKNDLRLMIKMYSDQQTGSKKARIDKLTIEDHSAGKLNW